MRMARKLAARERSKGTSRLRLAFLAASSLTIAMPAFADDTREGGSATTELSTAFQNPAEQAKPRIWWHWMNGNVTEEGIKADLEWMNRVGIGGATYFDVGGLLADYNIVDRRLIVGEDGWKSAIRLAVGTADRLGMEFATAASPGWSETGGPWVTPAQAMKKYAWSETVVSGGKRFLGKLPLPPETTGTFQDSPARLGANDQALPEFYADTMVVAYRMPEQELKAVHPAEIWSSSGKLDAAALRDGSLAKAQNVKAKGDAKTVWLIARYDRPVTVSGVSLGVAGGAASEGAVKPVVEVSQDGKSWKAGATLDGPAHAPLKTYSFAPLTGRYFRLTMPEGPPPGLAEALSAPPRAPGVHVDFSELVWHTTGFVDRLAEKAGFSEPIPFEQFPNPVVGKGGAIDVANVIELTSKMAGDGTLDWKPPAGTWRVIRLGYSLTGQRNAPAPVEATGLEVDKFSAEHVRAYVDEYLKHFSASAGNELVGKRGLQYLLTDSWEAGSQNWTDNMRAEFKARRGYDLAPWLPVLTGRIVASADKSDRFLWDFRRTIMDLMAQHYQVLNSELDKRGMGLYSEAQGDTWRAMADGMEIKSRADIPMAEYWFKGVFEPAQPVLKVDMKEASSVAHLYGRPLAATESLTVAGATPWGYSPAMLKPVIDDILAHGINRIVLHSSVHQPFLDRKPGLTLGLLGQYFNRNDTWAELAGPFNRYIGRASSLLQQGQYVADVAYFYGEQRPLANIFKGKGDKASGRLLIEVPQGFGYDFINAETLRSASNASDGSLKANGATRYKVLYLGGDTDAATVETLRKIEELVRGGVTLVGKRPIRALGLGGSDEEVKTIADRIWGDGNPSQPHILGRGKVYSTTTLADALGAEAISPDVEVVGNAQGYFQQLHRTTKDGEDIYFVVNRESAGAKEFVFRTAGNAPELWNAETGERTPLSYRIEGGRTIVPMDLAKDASAFVVFASKAKAPSLTVVAPKRSSLLAISDSWIVAFPRDRGAPASAKFDKLASWSENPDKGIQYFSGTASYSKTIEAPRKWWVKGRRFVLDLGDVKEIAVVRVNGKELPVQWKAPYRVDITEAMKPGKNQIEIGVTNLWPNRIMGDLQDGVQTRYTYTMIAPALGAFMWKKDSKLLPSGLLGPVEIVAEDSITH